MTRNGNVRGGIVAAVALAALLGAFAAPAWAAGEAVMDGVSPGRADANAAAPDAKGFDFGGSDDLKNLIRELSPGQVQELIKTAVRSRMEIERQQVAEEIKEDLLLDPADIEAAVKILTTDPKNTQTDNIQRSMRALAKVDYRFGKATKLLAQGKADQAAATIEKDLNVQEATYRNAARYTLYARALAAQKKYYDAVDAYQKILVVMADRISFAAAAAIESAAMYEKMQRFTYAAQMYTYAVNNYGLTLDDEVMDMIDRKITEYAEFSSNPLGWAGTAMGQVRKSLGSGDSGPKTQAKQEKIVAVITDMIKTAEEKKRQQSSQGRQRQRRQKPGEGEGQCQGKAQGQGRQPKGAQQPSNPAQVSGLVPGAVARPTKRSEVRDTNEAGDWANLPPRERQKLIQLRAKVMSERYRDLISKYRTKVAEQNH